MDTRVTLVVPSRIMDAIEGATIVSGRIDEGDGLCLNLQDGRCLIIAGIFEISLHRFDREKLH